MMQPQILTLGHSPDPDDAFMFYALANGLVETGGMGFKHVLQDIQTLNERALRGELDITAVSFHAYGYITDRYALLPCGASMGDGYGPVLVAKRKLTKYEILRSSIAVPGRLTSAFLALQLWLDRPAEQLSHVLVPFDKIIDAVKTGEADVGLLIHEGQLTYRADGLELCADLGQWWSQQQDGLPLPLGGNVIHKRIPVEIAKQVAIIISKSIKFALDHRADAVAYALQFGRGLDLDMADRFVGMYVNRWTLDYGERGREAVRRFLRLAHRQGLLPHEPELEFVL